MFKRILFIVIAFILIAAILPGCNNKTKQPEAPLSTVPAETQAPENTPLPVKTPVSALPQTTEPPPVTEPALSPAPSPGITPSTTPTPVIKPSPASPAVPLTILSISKGDLLVKRAGSNTWNKADEGITLKVGDTIKAGSVSDAEITFFDGSTIELQSSTEISVSELSISDSGSTTIRLSQNLGKTVSRVKKLVDPASRYEIDTPVGIAAVRGSIMIVTVDASGTTTVGNLEGDIRVIVNGTEYLIHKGMKRIIKPGHAPGIEVPLDYEPGGGGGGGGGSDYVPPVLQAKMDVTMLAEPTTVRVGDNITYSYLLKNTGDLSFHDISVINDVSANATYQSGNVNGNAALDPGETWKYMSVYTVQPYAPSPLIATATISALTPASVILKVTKTALTTVLPEFTVNITSPVNVSTLHERLINVTGTVNDVTVTSGTISINGESHPITISNGIFSTGEIMNNGENTIVVTVIDGQGHKAVATTIIDVETAVYGMRIELTWDSSGTDMNSHFIRPGGTFGDMTGDCFSRNKNPDWGIPGDTIDNPSLDRDVTDGFGPENITLQQPYDEGRYEYIVHYYNDNGHGPAIATVRIWINDTKIAEISKSLADKELWYCAEIGWPSGTVNEVTPGISIVKTAYPLVVHTGDNITYTYTVNNTGGMPLENIQVTDDRLGNVTYHSGDGNGNNVLDTGETWLFIAGYVPVADDPDLLENTANVSGNDALQRNVTASANASVAILKPGIAIDKTADHVMAHPGDNVTYRYEISNTGNTPLSDISVIDDRLGSIPYVSGDGNGDNLLDLQESWVFSAIYSVSDNDSSPLENIAGVSGIDSLGLKVSASDNTTVMILKPSIAVVKTASPARVHNGDNVTYTFEVTNTGNTPLSDITVVDNRLGSIPYVSGDVDGDNVLDVSETWIFSIIYKISCNDPTPLVNTVIVSGKDELLRVVTATGSASVTIYR